MKRYKKGRFEGFVPFAEITYNPENSFFSFHMSYADGNFDLRIFYSYLMMLLHEFFHPEEWKNKVYDTASPRDRKKLNERDKK